MDGVVEPCFRDGKYMRGKSGHVIAYIKDLIIQAVEVVVLGSVRG